MCELLLGELEPLVRGKASVKVRDVGDRPDWQSDYGERVPVVCFGGDEICQYRLDKAALLDKLAAAGDS